MVAASLSLLSGGGTNLTLMWLMLLAVVVSSGVEFKIDEKSCITLSSIPLLFAVLFLQPAEVIFLSFLFPLWPLRKLILKDPLMVAYNCGHGALVQGTFCWLVQRFAGQPLSAEEVLPVALLAGLSSEVVYNLLLPLYAETKQPGITREWISSMKNSTAFNVAASVLGVVLLAPYAANPLVIVMVLVAVQLVTYFVLRVANSERVQRKKNAQLKTAFSRYVPEGVVDSHADQMQEIELGGEQRQVSVLFADIRGFTSWSENLEPAVIVQELNALLTELTQAVFSTNGTLDKFTGDGLMAFWGAPVPAEDHAERATRSALEMLERLKVVNEQREAAGDPPFKIGIGVHSGPAVIGNIGHEKRLDYTAIGDTVNLSARLEASTKEAGCPLLISESTYLDLPQDLQQRAWRVGALTVKGRRQPVESFGLLPDGATTEQLAA